MPGDQTSAEDTNKVRHQGKHNKSSRPHVLPINTVTGGRIFFSNFVETFQLTRSASIPPVVCLIDWWPSDKYV